MVGSRLNPKIIFYDRIKGLSDEAFRLLIEFWARTEIRAVVNNDFSSPAWKELFDSMLVVKTRSGARLQLPPEPKTLSNRRRQAEYRRRQAEGKTPDLSRPAPGRSSASGAEAHERIWKDTVLKAVEGGWHPTDDHIKFCETHRLEYEAAFSDFLRWAKQENVRSADWDSTFMTYLVRRPGLLRKHRTESSGSPSGSGYFAADTPQRGRPPARIPEWMERRASRAKRARKKGPDLWAKALVLLEERVDETLFGNYLRPTEWVGRRPKGDAMNHYVVVPSMEFYKKLDKGKLRAFIVQAWGEVAAGQTLLFVVRDE